MRKVNALFVMLYHYCNPNPFLMLRLDLNTTLRQCCRSKYYTKTMFRLEFSISKVFEPASYLQVT